jgi:hypothetical protein
MSDPFKDENVYVAVCGRVLPNYRLGIQHERECPFCRVGVRESDCSEPEECELEDDE